MTGPRVPRLRLNSRITVDGQLHTVVGLNGTTVTLLDDRGQPSVVLLTHLLGSLKCLVHPVVASAGNAVPIRNRR